MPDTAAVVAPAGTIGNLRRRETMSTASIYLHALRVFENLLGHHWNPSSLRRLSNSTLGPMDLTVRVGAVSDTKVYRSKLL